MKSSWRTLKGFFRRTGGQQGDSSLDPEMLKEIARGIVTTRPDEITCDECFEQMDQFVEMTLAGKNAAEALPLVEDHLLRCKDCREEFEALKAALEAVG